MRSVPSHLIIKRLLAQCLCRALQRVARLVLPCFLNDRLQKPAEKGSFSLDAGHKMAQSGPQPSAASQASSKPLTTDTLLLTSSKCTAMQ